MRRATVGVLAVAVLGAAACAAPMPPPPPADGGPIPPGQTYRSIPFTPQDAPQLLQNLRNRIDTPEFAAQFDPSVRDQTLAKLRSQIDQPDALQKLTEYIAAENEASAKQNATGRLPAPLTSSQLQALGLTKQPNPPAPPVTPTTVPKVETKPLQPEIAASTSLSSQVPSDLKQYQIVPIGGPGWPASPLPGQPAGSQIPWPIAGGSLTEELRDALLAGTGNLLPGAPCSTLTTGSRILPDPPIPAFEGRIFSPTQGAIGRVDGGAPYHGELITRIDPQTGKRQFKVEAHLVSPLLDGAIPATNFRGHVVVEQLGTAPRSYFPGSAGTQWRTLCYKQDLGQPNPGRAYVEAWIPFEGFSEPGFQVRFETVDNFSFGAEPSTFYAADQATVLLQAALPPLTPDAVAPNGSLALRVDDRVLVDRDGNTTNDLESILTSQLLPLLEPAVEDLQGNLLGIPPFAFLYFAGVDLSGPSLDLDVRPIAGDDEHEFTAAFDLGRLHLDTFFGAGDGVLLQPCGFSVDLRGTANFSGRVGRSPADPSRLTLSGVSAVTDVRAENKVALGPPELASFLVCVAILEGVSSDFPDLVQGIVDDQVTPLTDTLGDDLTLEVDDVAGPGITTAAGGGFGIDLAGFGRTCEARGCQGGDVLLDEDGIVLGADLRVRDGKSPTDARRFPYTFNPYPVLSDSLLGRFMDVKTQSGARYDAALTLNPAFLNQILRALAEGGATSGTGTLDADGSSGGTGFTVDAEVAPIVVTRQLFPDQPPLTIFVPDLRISDGSNTFAVNAAVGVGLEIDSATRRLRPRLVVGVDVDTLSCPFGRDLTGLFNYSVCANRDWNLGSGPTLPSIPDLANYVVNSLISPLLRDSIGEIEIPTVSGFDFVALGDTRVESRNGFPTLYVGIKNGGLRVVPSGTASTLTVVAPVSGLPGTGPITWDFQVRDLNSSVVLDPPPGTSGLLTAPASSFTVGGPFLFGLGTRRVSITVTASRGGTTFTATQNYSWLGPA